MATTAEQIKSAATQGANVAKSAGRAALSAVGKNVMIGAAIGKLTGASWGEAISNELKQAALTSVAPGLYWARMIGSLTLGIPNAIYEGGVGAAGKYNMERRRMAQPTFTYQDTQEAVTMRQAAVQAIQGSKLNARNALGGEASLLHRGYRDRYR